jgi:hypothetical protein
MRSAEQITYMEATLGLASTWMGGRLGAPAVYDTSDGILKYSRTSL